MRTIQTDVAIIGSGTAGMTAYRAVKKRGKRALLIESEHYGTTCARVGCMPSKLLIAAAHAAHAIRQAPAFGIHADGPLRVDGREVMARVRTERDRFVGAVLRDVDEMPAEDKCWGRAKFLPPGRAGVEGDAMPAVRLQVGDDMVVEAGAVVIATGAAPVIPDMYRAAGGSLAVNDDVFEWQELPRSVMVVGTGVIGLELGQALARLGVRVLVLGRGDSLAGISDENVKASALEAFREEFDIALQADVRSVECVNGEVRVEYVRADGSRCQDAFERVLMAAGRKPRLQGLGLEDLGVALDDKGMPDIDPDTLQLKGHAIFLAGDVNGLHPVLHEATDDGYIAGANAADFPDHRPGKRRTPLGIIFTEPQIARVGRVGKSLPPDAVVGEVDFRNQGRARIMLENRGVLRVYAEPGTGLLLGAEIVGPRAEHLAHLLAWSVQQSLTVGEMVEMPFYHPVLEEGLRTALRSAAGKARGK